MSYVLRAVPAMLRFSVSGMLQYRAEIILWAVWGVVHPLVAIAMWSAAAKESSTGTGNIHGYGPREFAAYFLMNMIVGHFCTAWDVYEMGYQVRSGSMSGKLLRPLMPVWSAMTDNFAFKSLTAVVLVPVWGLVAWVAEPKFETTWVQGAVGVFSLFVASFLNFVWGYTLAAAAFWVTRMDGLGEIWFGLSLFLGGRMAPMEILPWQLQWGALLLPHQWINGFPCTLLMGRVSAEEMTNGVIIQLAWLVAGVVLLRIVWREGVKRYSAVGA